MNRSEEWADYLDPAESDPDVPPAHRELLERFAAALADEAVWTNPPAELRSRLLERAAAEPVAAPPAEPPAQPFAAPPADPGSAPADGAPGTVTPLNPARRSRRRWWVAAAGVAAAAVLVVAIAWPRPQITTYAMSGTPFAPTATARADLESRSAGLAITLHVKGLPPAPPGTYYAGWLRGPGGDVPVGTFHWRKGGIPIELWSGVLTDQYPVLQVTLQHEGDPPTPSGDVVLTGRVSAPTG